MAIKNFVAVIVLLMAVSSVPVITFAARDINTVASTAVTSSGKGFVVEGKVFCDTCGFGYETPLSTYIPYAQVMVECRSKTSGATTCSFPGETDHTGMYRVLVSDAHEDHEHEICEVVAVSSKQAGCSTTKVPGREKARVFLAHNNGIASDTRFANAVGFMQDAALPACAPLKQLYDAYSKED